MATQDYWNPLLDLSGQPFQSGLVRTFLPRRGVANPGTREVYTSYHPIWVSHEASGFYRGVLIQGADGGETNWWTTLQNLKVRLALMSSNGQVNDASAVPTRTGLPATVLKSMTTGVTWGTAASASNFLAGQTRSRYFFEFDGGVTLYPGCYWIQMLSEIYYTGEPRAAFVGERDTALSQNSRRTGDGLNTICGLVERRVPQSGGIDNIAWLENRTFAQLSSVWNTGDVGAMDAAPAFTNPEGLPVLKLGLKGVY